MAAGMGLAVGTTPAFAQDAADPHASDRVEVARMLDQLTTTLAGLAERLDITVPDFAPLFTPLFQTVFRDLPEDGDSSFSIGFNFNTSVVDGETVERRDDWTPVYADAQACAAGQPGMAVVHFERLAVSGGTGHHCIVTGPGRRDPESWGLLASYVVETPRRRLESRVGAAAATGKDGDIGTYAAAAAIGERQIPAMIALSEQMGLTATDMMVAAPVPDPGD